MLAFGALAILAWHLYQLDALARWAGGTLEVPVPEGRGTWGIAYGALYRRVRLRTARQRDLRLALDRFVSGAEALPDGVVVLDARDRIRWANLRAQTHLGIDLAHDVDAPIVNLVRQPAFVQYLANGDFSEPVVVASQREAAMMLSIQIVPFGVEERLLMSRDITRLEAVARMRRDFIANVSHELKTPLTVVTGFLETLSDLKVDERQRQRYIALMQEQAQNMQRLVDDLLTLSALESEHSAVQDAEFAIVPLLLQVSADAKALSGGRHEITLSIHDAANVVGSHDELASAFGNLVSNAVRYTPDGGRIALDWRVTPEAGEFTVADTGIGIARGAHPAADRAVLSRRSQPLARDRGHRPRARDRQARPDPAPGRAGDRQRPGAGQPLHRAAAGAAGEGGSRNVAGPGDLLVELALVCGVINATPFSFRLRLISSTGQSCSHRTSGCSTKTTSAICAPQVQYVLARYNWLTLRAGGPYTRPLQSDCPVG